MNNDALSKSLRYLFSFLLVTLLGGCNQIPDGLEAVTSFDVQRYKGRWFEIMRLDNSFERGLSHVTATYDLRDDGTVSVLNRGFNGANCEWEEAKGVAVFQQRKTVGSLSVSFFWPFSGGYHVIGLDRKNYHFALVSGPSREYLWILSREPVLAADVRQKLIEEARKLGFPVSELVMVKHGDRHCRSLSGPRS